MSIKKQYHQSEIHNFLKCGKQWEFRYVQNIRTPPKAALTVGSSVDAAVTRNLIQKIETKQDLKLNDVLDACSTDFDIRAKETVWDGEDPGGHKDVAIALAKVHHQMIAPKVDPETVQEEFALVTDSGFDIGGIIDFTEKSGVIADTKTSRLKYAPDAVSRSLQAAIYDFAYEALRGKKAKSFRYDVLIKPTKTKPPEVQQVEAKVTDEDRIWLFNTIQNMDKAIKAGVTLPAADGSWWCSKDWCGYWHMCKGKK